MTVGKSALLRFAKAHAYGNDFLYVKARTWRGHASVRWPARWRPARHVGADGLIVYQPGMDEVGMRLLNADGSRAEVSGNGVRALAALLLNQDAAADASVTIRTEAGVKQVSRTGRDGSRQIFCTAVGPPRDVRKVLPLEVAG